MNTIPTAYQERLRYVLDALHHLQLRVIDIEAAAVPMLQITEQRIEAVLEEPARVWALRVQATNDKRFRITLSSLPHPNLYVEEAADGMLCSSNASMALLHALQDAIARSSTTKGPKP